VLGGVRTVTTLSGERDVQAAWALELDPDRSLTVNVLSSLSASPSRVPREDELFLWFGAPAEDEPTVSLDTLQPDERTRSTSFSQTSDQWNYVAARRGLRILVGAALGCAPGDVALARGAHGKPSLDARFHGSACAARVEFSVSHTRDLVAVALSGRTVGIDVEAREAEHLNYMAIARRAFAPEAFAELCAIGDVGERLKRFFEIWTMGEAFVKATGQGLAQGMGGFAFTRGAVGLARASPPWGPASRWRFGLVS